MTRVRPWLLALVGTTLTLLVAWSALREQPVELAPSEEPPRAAPSAPEVGPRLEGRLATGRPIGVEDTFSRYREAGRPGDGVAGDTTQAAPTEVGRLSGTVYRVDGSVVAGATVRVSRQPTRTNSFARMGGRGWQPWEATGSTDANGVFVLENIPSGIELRIEVIPAEGRWWSAVQRRTDELLCITLPHDVPLAGRVIDVVTRRPAQSVQVKIESSSLGEQSTQDTKTDDQGEFRVLVPSDATCTIRAVLHTRRSDTLGLSLRETPEGLDVLDTTSATAGGAYVELRLWRGHEITGHIAGWDGAGWDGAGWDGTTQPAPLRIQVYARTRGGELDQRRRADLEVRPDGSFLVDLLPPGRFDLVFVPPEGTRVSGRPATMTWVSKVAAPAEGLEVRLREGATMHGQLVDLEGRPIVLPEGYVYVRDQDDVASGVGGVFATLDGRGGFSTPALPVDRAHVVLAGGFEGYARTEVREARPGEPRLVVRLRPSRRLRGVVRDAAGRPVGARVPVTAWIKGREASGESSRAWAHTDAEGRFLIEGLTAEAYELVAGGCGSLFAPSETLHDVPADSTELVLRVVPGAQLGGRLVDARGVGVQALTLIASGTDAPAPCASSTHVDSPLGSFLLTGLPLGRARLSLMRDGKSVDLGEVDVPSERVRVVVPDP